MADNPKMSIDSNNNLWVLEHTVPSSGTTTHILQTQNTFLDKNISLKITATPAGAPTLAITDKGSTNIGVGTVSAGYYPLTTSLTGTMSFASAGWIGTDGAQATDDTVTVGRIIQSTLSEGATSSGANTNVVIVPAVSTNKYVNITEGYEKNRYVTIAPMSSGTAAAAKVNVTGTVGTPTVGNAATTITGMTKVDIAPTTTQLTTATGKYYIAISVTAPGVTPTVTPSVTTAGYLGTASQITKGTNSIAANSNLYYAGLTTAQITLSGTTAATLPTAEQNTATINGKTRIAATPTTAVSSITNTNYVYALTVRAPVTTVSTSSLEIDAGYITETDTNKINASFSTQESSRTYYVPIAAGQLSASTGTAAVTGNKVSVTLQGTKPSTDTFYITATGSGSVKVGTAGWLPQNASLSSNTATVYYSLPTATFTATGGTVKSVNEGYISANTNILSITAGQISTTSTNPSSGYTENTTAIVPSNGYLLLSAGYYNATKISLATLVPDTTSNTAAAVSHILAGYKAFDKDGKLLTGTIPTYDGSYTYQST